MTNSAQNTFALRVGKAARMLIEGNMANASARRFSRTLFAANRTNDETVERIMFGAALDNGHGAVSLRFGAGAGAMPRRANVAMVDAGERIVMRDCALWSEEDGPVLLVPFAARQDFHFAVGPAGLERRPGRPATVLGSGMSRAKARFERLVRSLRPEDLGQHLTILTDAAAA